MELLDVFNFFINKPVYFVIVLLLFLVAYLMGKTEFARRPSYHEGYAHYRSFGFGFVLFFITGIFVLTFFLKKEFGGAVYGNQPNTTINKNMNTAPAIPNYKEEESSKLSHYKPPLPKQQAKEPPAERPPAERPEAESKPRVFHFVQRSSSANEANALAELPKYSKAAVIFKKGYQPYKTVHYFNSEAELKLFVQENRQMLGAKPYAYSLPSDSFSVIQTNSSK